MKNHPDKYFLTELKTPYRAARCVVLERFVARERNRFGHFQNMDFVHVFWADSDSGDFMPAAVAIGRLPDCEYRAPVVNPRSLTDEEKKGIVAALAPA